MRWFNRYNFPYSNFHDLNLDWILKEMKRVVEEWEQVKAEWEQMKIDWAEFQAEMQRLWQEYQDLRNAAWEAFQEAMRDEWDEYKDQLNQEWDDYKAQMNSDWAAYQANLNAQWNEYQTNLNTAWNNYQTAMNAWKDDVDSDIADKFAEIDEKCAQCKADVDAALANLNTVLANVQQQVTNYLNNLNYEPIIRDETNNWLDEHGVTLPSNVINPKDFGAVGDGITDDYSAFSSAIDESHNKNKPLFIPPGSYYLSSSPFSGWNTPRVIYGAGAYLRCSSPIVLNSTTVYGLGATKIQAKIATLYDIQCTSLTDGIDPTSSSLNPISIYGLNLSREQGDQPVEVSLNNVEGAIYGIFSSFDPIININNTAGYDPFIIDGFTRGTLNITTQPVRDLTHIANVMISNYTPAVTINTDRQDGPITIYKEDFTVTTI